jgi:cyclin-dependent kinase regulatory subunit CKS1
VPWLAVHGSIICVHAIPVTSHLPVPPSQHHRNDLINGLQANPEDPATTTTASAPGLKTESIRGRSREDQRVHRKASAVSCNITINQLLKTLSIHYSDRYSDDEYEYRHVILPKPLFKMIPKSYFNPDDPGVLRLLSEAEWRGIGITQSLGWEHYEVHGTLSLLTPPLDIFLTDSATTPSVAPEPHVLLFRRLKNADALHAAQQVHEMHPQIKAAGAAKNGRKK